MNSATHSKALLTQPAAILAAALVGGCAADAWKPAPGYDGFLSQAQHACYDQRIGMYKVGDLLAGAGGMLATHFMDATSRLYFGKITPDIWTSSVTASLQGRAGDPGVRCVLEQLQLERSAQGHAAPPPGR